ncbi:ATPase inhibitor [Lithohypha guttulata]|uniref:ATPase inhibitor, mitochondrial n=1 Tax=Lithohypha guttulata TaxID=1690604 RepID=A0AAN7SUR5_9EURO|nr:ATPase inhibitor [Lithohypha guttulata]KAK5082109.1 ATPase inhibitor [Lithohypha guttulata]KAK5105436.1 ATPase inhibitor [Lithohypha guttulata]
MNMLRTSAFKLNRASSRSFSAAALRQAEGDVGGTRFGGSAASDSFNKREQASENKFIREREKEALKALKEKLKAQRAHLDDLDKHIDELERGAGGEQN